MPVIHDASEMLLKESRHAVCLSRAVRRHRASAGGCRKRARSRQNKDSARTIARNDESDSSTRKAFSKRPPMHSTERRQPGAGQAMREKEASMGLRYPGMVMAVILPLRKRAGNLLLAMINRALICRLDAFASQSCSGINPQPGTSQNPMRQTRGRFPNHRPLRAA